MTLNEFQTAYPNESNSIEWKVGSSRKPIQNAIVAFSNSDGGILIIGVDDSGSPVGRPLDSGLEKQLWETINSVESPGAIELHRLSVENVEVTVVSISRRRQGVSQTSDGRILVRRGKQNLPLTGTDLVELVKHRIQDSFDGNRLADRTDLLPTDRRILIEAARGKELTNSAVRALLDVDSSTARQILQRLHKTGLLEQAGQRRGTRYRIALNLGWPAQVGLNHAELREEVLRMAEDTPVTNAILRDRLSLSRAEAVRLLNGLVADDLLALRGSKRGSHYVLARST